MFILSIWWHGKILQIFGNEHLYEAAVTVSMCCFFLSLQLLLVSGIIFSIFAVIHFFFLRSIKTSKVNFGLFFEIEIARPTKCTRVNFLIKPLLSNNLNINDKNVILSKYILVFDIQIKKKMCKMDKIYSYFEMFTISSSEYK